MQLPPTLSGFTDEKKLDEGLGKTLFIRLASIGYEPVMLRTQYRVYRLAYWSFYERILMFISSPYLLVPSSIEWDIQFVILFKSIERWRFWRREIDIGSIFPRFDILQWWKWTSMSTSFISPSLISFFLFTLPFLLIGNTRPIWELL